MSDIGYEGKNEFEMIKVELGDDKEYVKRYDVSVFPDFGVFVNGEYFRYYGQKLAGYGLHFFWRDLAISCSSQRIGRATAFCVCPTTEWSPSWSRT